MGKMKKWLLAALTLGCVLSFAFGCGGKGGDAGESSSLADGSSVASSEENLESSEREESSQEISSSEDSSTSVHTCITEGTWKISDDGHWLKCDCGKLVGYGSHYGEAVDCESQPVCETCETPYGKAPGHTYGELSDGTAGKAYYCKCGEYITNENLVDFVLNVDGEKDPVVLQISDTQLTSLTNVENLCYRYVRDAVEKTQPDLIILTGDIIYGRFDPNGDLLKDLISFMETLDTPWAPVFGNHDNESLMGVDWQCAQLEAAENCLFKQGDVTGNGNYSVGFERDGELIRVFYMMDSNGCGKPMCDSNGVQTKPAAGTNEVATDAGFGADQVRWFTQSVEKIHAVDADVKISMAYHIQPTIFSDAFGKYDEYNGMTSSGSILYDPLNLDEMETADDTDFGYLGRAMKGPWYNSSLSISNLKELCVDSIFVGHEHCNSVSIVYEGIRFQYGQKSSQYDRYNSVKDGEIYGGYMDDHPTGAIALMGGTVIPISAKDGSIGTGYICYYGNPFGTKSGS